MSEVKIKICPYCGQTGIDECDCVDAKRERVRLEYLERANDEIDKMLMPEEGACLATDDTISFIKAIAENVSYKEMQSVRVSLVGGIVITLKRAATGAIKIELSENKKSAVTVSENVRCV